MASISNKGNSLKEIFYPGDSFNTGIQEFYQRTSSQLVLFFEAISCIPSFMSSALKWQRDRKANVISTYDLTSEKTKRTGQLFQHGILKSVEERSAIIFLHGDYGHPRINYPLIETAQQTSSKPVFSIFLPYSNSIDPEEHRALLEKGIQKIQELFAEKGETLRNLTMIGVSKGAIESAHYAFYRLPREENPMVKVDKIISIAGRLKVVPSKHGIPCHPNVQLSVNEAYQGILEHPEIPLYQICGDRDWNAPTSAMAVRPDQNCFIQKGEGHVTISYSKETKRLLQKILN